MPSSRAKSNTAASQRFFAVFISFPLSTFNLHHESHAVKNKIPTKIYLRSPDLYGKLLTELQLSFPCLTENRIMATNVIKQELAKRKRFTVVGLLANAQTVDHVLATDVAAAKVAVNDARNALQTYVSVAVFAGYQEAIG
jgi:hypothetical protein